MFFKCCVKNCASTREDAVLHKFPIDEKRLDKWITSLKDVSLTPSSIKNLFVCQKHFEKIFIGAKLRLLSDAYPSLFTPVELTTGKPANDDDAEDLARNREHDHSYSRKKHYDHTYYKPEEVPSTSGAIKEAAGSSGGANINMSASKEPILSESFPKTPYGVATTSQNKITTTPKRSLRKKLIHKVNSLTPKCKLIYKEFTKAKKQLEFHRRAKQAVKFSKKQDFDKLIHQLNPYARKIMEMQINLCTKKKKGRRFSLDEKLIALAIMKQSPKSYRFLHKIFILPSSSTLNKMVSGLNIESGINKQFLNLIKKEVESWPDSRKYCSLLFDEMSLGMGLSYDSKHDQISGFVDLGERKGQFADHVLVFMLRGAVHKWQQPLAYYFCEGATSGRELKTILKEIIPAIAETGLKPLVLGCDQGSAFQWAVKSLLADTRREQLLRNEHTDDTVIIGESKLNIIYDPSHLIKGIRNNFLSKDILYEGKLSRWTDIVDVYNTDANHTETRLLHKLNDEHVIPDKIKKMKVKNCVRVLSKTVAAALSYTAHFSHYIDGTPVSSTLKNTAEIVSFFDDLFDSINGTATSIKKAKGKSLRTAVREASRHHEFWVEAIKKLEKMRFVENGRNKIVPTLHNFITTLKSYIKLWQVFKSFDLKIMRPRYFNTDPIENYFGQVRAYNYRNNYPTCHNFTNTFKALTITRVINFHSDTYNCEDDPAKQLFNLHILFSHDNDDNEENIQSDHPGPSVVPAEPVLLNVEGVIEQARRERLNVHSRAYTTGWVIRKIFSKISCKVCKKSLTGTPQEVHEWISHREYKECQKELKLVYPSEKAVRFFGLILTETNNYLEKYGYKKNIIRKIKENLRHKLDLFGLVNCTEHRSFIAECFLNINLRFCIFNWCNRINKILKGVDILRLQNKSLPPMQQLALKKYSKKLKNKSLNK